MKILKNDAFLLFILVLSVFVLFSNKRPTTSMDIDVVNAAKNLYETGSYGAESALSSGIVYSPKTDKFYPLEGPMVVIPVYLTYSFSKLISSDSLFPMYMTNQILSAFAVMFLYLTLKIVTCRKKSLVIALLFAFATPVFVHSKYLLPEPATMMVFSGALYFYFKYFYDGFKPIYLNFSVIFTLLSLHARPDSPIFVGLFSFLIIAMLIKFKKLKTHFFYFFIPALFFLAQFLVGNYSRFGSIFETGYTVKRDAMTSTLEVKIQSQQNELDELYDILKIEYDKNPKGDLTANLYAKYQAKTEILKSREKFYKETKNREKEYGAKPSTIQINSIGNYFYGLILSLIYPNRSIIFLSPFIIFLIPLTISFYKKYKFETLFILGTFFLYLSLYSLRAPNSYAGSAAWGVRYLLPMYPLFFILFGAKIPEFYKKTLLYKMVLPALMGLSVIFQIIGSAVNYQSVQMPLEYVCKQKYGTSDMTWAHESRKELMTSFRASLLLNNLNIIFKNPPSVMKYYLDQQTYKRIKSENLMNSEINDWFFLDLLTEGDLAKVEKPSLFKLLLLIIIATAIYSGFSLFKIIGNDKKAV
ncbi:MAG: hypothetical protein JXR48_14180 [Candidatus Delongbacteria bacterium]|nr:hypothetical protein [Candidatus Delongbacteria bacterium]MBN2836103.1 hypothetical protein [Candidatus Delongbacteria bacterium]